MTTTSHPLSAGRQATATQGWTLTAANWLAAVAVAVLAPVLPKIAQHFQSDPHVDVLVSLVATLPAFFVALGSWPTGLLADRLGTRRVLLFGVGAYGFVGCAPLLLNSLAGIVITRAGVGICEAVIMTCTTALVADYFSGDKREWWLAVQAGSGGVIVVSMLALGGMLGERGWRLPFIMYGMGFILFPLCLFKTWEPARKQRRAAEKHNWGPLARICLITFFALTCFFVMMIQLSFILAERGVTDTRTVGLGIAAAVLFMLVGSMLFKLVRLPVTGKLTISFALSAAGFFVLALAHSFFFTEVGAAINGLGGGMVLPTLITWALANMAPEVRARGTGIWQTAAFLGQFASPLTILFLKNALGTRGMAVLVFAVACSIAAAIAAIAYIRTDARSAAMVEAA